MRHLVKYLTICLAVPVAAVADPVEGVWKTQVDDGAYAHIEIAPCGTNFCGVMKETFNSEGAFQSPNIGRMIVIDMAADGAGGYTGKVWRPSNDKIYNGKMELDGDSLQMGGCVAGGLICSKQTWTRLK